MTVSHDNLTDVVNGFIEINSTRTPTFLLNSFLERGDSETFVTLMDVLPNLYGKEKKYFKKTIIDLAHKFYPQNSLSLNPNECVVLYYGWHFFRSDLPHKNYDCLLGYAIDQGFAYAVSLKGMELLIKNDIANGIAHLKTAAKHGSRRALITLGLIYLEGQYNLPVNTQEGWHALRLAIDRGAADAKYLYGLYILKKQLFRREAGQVMDMHHLAAAYSLFTQTAKVGHADALLQLSDLYRYGIYTARDLKKADFLCNMVIKHSNVFSTKAKTIARAQNKLINSKAVHRNHSWLWATYETTRSPQTEIEMQNLKSADQELRIISPKR